MAGYQKNPFPYMLKSFGYLMTSLFEGFPNALVEAMVCGCPIIAGDCKSGPREILFKNRALDKCIVGVEEADYGLIIPNITSKENWNPNVIEEFDRQLAEAIILLSTNEELHQRYREKGKLRVEEFNYEICKNKYIKAIEG